MILAVIGIVAAIVIFFLLLVLGGIVLEIIAGKDEKIPLENPTEPEYDKDSHHIDERA